MTFEYLYKLTPQDSIDIEDMGNVIIQANNDDADEWYLSISTKLGWTTVKDYGPLTIDDDSLGYSFSFNYKRFEYSEQKIYKLIDFWLNDKKKNITQLRLITKQEFDKRLKGLKDDSSK